MVEVCERGLSHHEHRVVDVVLVNGAARIRVACAGSRFFEGGGSRLFGFYCISYPRMLHITDDCVGRLWNDDLTSDVDRICGSYELTGIIGEGFLNEESEKETHDGGGGEGYQPSRNMETLAA